MYGIIFDWRERRWQPNMVKRRNRQRWRHCNIHFATTQQHSIHTKPHRFIWKWRIFFVEGEYFGRCCLECAASSRAVRHFCRIRFDAIWNQMHIILRMWSGLWKSSCKFVYKYHIFIVERVAEWKSYVQNVSCEYDDFSKRKAFLCFFLFLVRRMFEMELYEIEGQKESSIHRKSESISDINLHYFHHHRNNNSAL